ncbi:unnamed protein product [Mycena citricolor]|uniref:chitin synthase n=1 Tax=Mycena citricolor TaxID=2018698 RepID=A0AAD2K1G0_9AGAR|nr:unnamed protein product [Mycena citricolor]CAK5283736.1 unnamed protein product [Mycena citricolor]
MSRPPRHRPPSGSPASSSPYQQERPFLPNDGSRGNVSFAASPSPSSPGPHQQRVGFATGGFHHAMGGAGDAESGGAAQGGFGGQAQRKKSLVRPEREKIDPGHRQWHYRSAVTGEGGAVGVQASTTGNYPHAAPLHRGRSLLARDQDVHESGLALFKRGPGTLLRRRSSGGSQSASTPLNPATAKTKSPRTSCFGDYAPGPKGPWMLFCYLLTCWIPPALMRGCGLKTREQQRAWREKMGLIAVIAVEMAVVGFVTFGFTAAVCGAPGARFHGGLIGIGGVGNGSVVIHGWDYDLTNFHHPAAGPFDGHTNPILVGGWGLAGNDASFMFQKTNQACVNILNKANGSQITGTGAFMDWYFPCNVFGTVTGGAKVNQTAYGSSGSCHVSSKGAPTGMKAKGQVYYTWDDVRASGRRLAVFESNVLDLSLLSWLDPAQVSFPPFFAELAAANSTYTHTDITMGLMRQNRMSLGHCLQDTITVGFIDTNSIGCVASQVLLYVSLVFIIGVVLIRFVMACLFAWFFAPRIGGFPTETYEDRMKRAEEIEAWSSDIYKPAPSARRPNVKSKTFIPSTSRFTPADVKRPASSYAALDSGSSVFKRSTVFSEGAFAENPCPFPLGRHVVPQPPPDYEPFNFPLAHTICLVTAYSESVQGLRTTLDSLSTTDYPNSHKVILIIADGMVKGAGNDLTTPDICLSMMRDLVVPIDEVEPHSYVAIADGHKRHNMAKVYAGYYEYDNSTVERSKQQRVPIVLVAKVGNPLEANDAKPGNRGKRDSQIVLMAFLQKVMFDERMTTFEYEFFNSLWRVTGVSPDRYELVLCVDADTKVFPDSLNRMVSCMVRDHDIMGLCGETKVANKAETFVTMMQVFEYYISHHMTKAFESMFGGVTCLPGCFSMYRIKVPKGDSGFWVPILANPDVVEHYSENVVDTLHKKNLLLLGEDRYLTTLMLKTFPKRKNMFCPAAVCKTIVPDTFQVLLSQRRRWINSTVHNLFELILVRDLCGTFCFSMQFVVGMELAGTLVLPAAISFTLYLIISSIIPGGPNTTVSLVLLAFVLGIPLVLIVITSRKIAYLGWMIIYLISLPIWNGVLPAYSFWHFDDFSWGQTRMVDGENKETAAHGDKEGEFDSTHIVMKRWTEFERERRAGIRSDYRNETPKRYSLASSAYDASASTSTESGNRMPHDGGAGVLTLPTPLSVSPRQSGPRQSLTAPSASASASSLSTNPASDPFGTPRLGTFDDDTYSYTQSPSQGQFQFGTQTPPQSQSHSPPPAQNRQPRQPHAPQPVRPPVRGVSLIDSGPVPGPEGAVRRVAKRSSTAAPRSGSVPAPIPQQVTGGHGLPPGAAAPAPATYGLPPGAAAPTPSHRWTGYEADDQDTEY